MFIQNQQYHQNQYCHRNRHRNHRRQQQQLHLGLNNFLFCTAAVLTVAVLWSNAITSVSGAPAKLDANVATLPLEQPAPFVRQAFAAAYEAAADKAIGNTQHQKRATTSSTSSIDDSYGNPIESLRPIDTPDGRKVVSAQGLQFEIPNYASGITEIKKPADDLLPPFIAPFEPTGTQTANDADGGLAGDAAPADQERFPPNGLSKTTYTKNEDGKVITTTGTQQAGSRPVFNTGLGVRGSFETEAKDLPTSQFDSTVFGASSQIPQQSNSFFASKPTTGPATATSPFAFRPTTSPAFGFRVATESAVANAGAQAPAAAAGKPRNPFLPATFDSRRVATATAGSDTSFTAVRPNERSTTKDKYRGNFGGPPGVLTPYDNVPGGGSA